MAVAHAQSEWSQRHAKAAVVVSFMTQPWKSHTIASAIFYCSQRPTLTECGRGMHGGMVGGHFGAWLPQTHSFWCQKDLWSFSLLFWQSLSLGVSLSFLEPHLDMEFSTGSSNMMDTWPNFCPFNLWVWSTQEYGTGHILQDPERTCDLLCLPHYKREDDLTSDYHRIWYCKW